MKKYQFKTNINCSNCVAKVTPFLSANDQIKHWSVDTNNAQKILTIETENLSPETVKNIVKSAGFTAESLQQ